MDNYDRIARFYDVDMAQNMPFDDVAFYADLCAHADGPVLELGCGNGRILLALLRAGIDATGIDMSAGMLAELRRKAAVAGLRAPVAQMDIRRLALRERFAVVLCPYSLITYLTTADDVGHLLQGVRHGLRPGGRFVVDAFVPQPVTAGAEFRLDYRRPFEGGTLTRWKRLQPAGPSTNRIERRYEVGDATGQLRAEVAIAETIRPYRPEDLRTMVSAAGFAPEREWWNYGAQEGPAGAQFYTLAARRMEVA
jgi:SAM-dependent methyltransferase